MAEGEGTTEVSYQFHPGAGAEHLEAIAYYEAQQPELGASYLAEFETVLERVYEVPSRYPIEQTCSDT